MFDLFHALSFCVELFKREIRGSFMLMCRTKAAAYGAGRPGRCPEAGLGREGRRHPACACLSRAPGTDKTTLHSCKHKASALRLFQDLAVDMGRSAFKSCPVGTGGHGRELLLSQEKRLQQNHREYWGPSPRHTQPWCPQKLSLCGGGLRPLTCGSPPSEWSKLLAQL